MTAVRTKRVYGRAQPGDGSRVLVDRLWPRGKLCTKAEFPVPGSDAVAHNDASH